MNAGWTIAAQRLTVACPLTSPFGSRWTPLPRDAPRCFSATAPTATTSLGLAIPTNSVKRGRQLLIWSASGSTFPDALWGRHPTKFVKAQRIGVPSSPP